MTVDLPWPSPKLHPNARVHWAVRSKAVKAARSMAAMLARAAQGRNIRAYDGTTRIPVTVTIYPPDRRLRDRDGMQSLQKSYLDGIADALMVNDYLFDPRYTFGDPVKGGKVIVQIGEPGGTKP